MTKRKGIKIELTSTQIEKMWPLFQAVVDDSMATGKLSTVSVMGQAWVSDTGAVRGFAKFALLTTEETVAVRKLLGGTGTTMDEAS